MRKADVPEWFAALMVTLAESWGAKLTEARIRLYAAALADVPEPQLRLAAERAVRESAFFPTVAYLRQCVGLSPEDAGVLAWASLRAAAAAHGAYASLTVADGAAAEALEVACGSWPAFCALEEGPALHTRRAEFLAAYRALRGRVPARRLAGLCETTGHYSPRSIEGVIGAMPALPSAERRLIE